MGVLSGSFTSGQVMGIWGKLCPGAWLFVLLCNGNAQPVLDVPRAISNLLLCPAGCQVGNSELGGWGWEGIVGEKAMWVQEGGQVQVGK